MMGLDLNMIKTSIKYSYDFNKQRKSKKKLIFSVMELD